MKKTLSMRKQSDPREMEMFEKCDLVDAVERMQIKEKQVEDDRVTGYMKLWPLLRPKWIIFVGLILVIIAQTRTTSQGYFMGQFTAILSTPFDLAIL